MEFRILGSLEAEAEGRLLGLGRPSERIVLAVLLLDAGRVVSLSRLVDALWEDDPPPTAAKLARNAVSRLRRLLAAGAAANVITTIGGGYRVDVSDHMVDSRLFETRIRQAGLAASEGLLADAAETLRSALGLWRGPFLDGMQGRVIATAAAAWNERRCTATETYYDHQLTLGQHREIISELSALAAAQPLREKTAEQFMVALYRCGRQADALAVYRTTRVRLADELGIDPGPQLQRLHQQILTADPGLAAPPESGTLPHAASPPGSTPRPRQLPAALRHFAGRQQELKALTSLLDPAVGPSGAVVISAIDGAAGIGKTALAVHWAHQVADRFPDGQLYASLRGFDPSGSPAVPAEVIRGFLEALGVPSARIPGSLDAQAGLYRSLLADKRVLVVLDNARDVAQVRPLLPGSPTCLVVVTSRVQLTGLAVTDGAVELTLGLLSPADAYELAARRLGRPRLAAEPEATEEMITLCARLPLALSIVAARAAARPELPLRHLVSELADTHDRLDALDPGDPGASVRAAFSWSYRNLSQPAARMFRLIGAHPGPDISVTAAASLAGCPPGQARQALRELAQAYLIEEPVPGRFTFHDLLRAYSTELAHGIDGTARDAAIARMLDHYVHTAHAADGWLHPDRERISLGPPAAEVTLDHLAGYQQALTWMEAELPVLRAVVTAAARAGFDTHAWQIAWTLAAFLHWRGYWHDWLDTQRIALAAAQRTGDRDAQACTHRELGGALIRLGDFADARTHFMTAICLYLQLGDIDGQASTYRGLAWAMEHQGRYPDALADAERALDLSRASGNLAEQAKALNAVGWYHALLGNHRQALTYCRQALHLHRRLGNQMGEADTWDSLGLALHHLGRHSAAFACYQHALGFYRKSGDRYNQAGSLSRLGDAQLAAGDRAGARSTWLRALAIFDELKHADADQIRAKLAEPQRLLA